MKTIRYRGGLLTFRIPDEWREEHGADGGSTFYQDDPTSGALQLYTITLARDGGLDDAAVLEMAGAESQPGDQAPVLLPTGHAFRRYSRVSEEPSGTRIVHYWHLAAGVPPDTVRLAIFSYTQAFDPSDPMSAVLEDEIRRARFTGEPPLDPLPRRPWWKWFG